MPQLKILHATTKTQSGQINNFKGKKKTEWETRELDFWVHLALADEVLEFTFIISFIKPIKEVWRNEF